MAHAGLLRLAHGLLLRETRSATFDTCELVQETEERLLKQRAPFVGREHIYRMGRLLMSRVLIDRSRRRRRLKHQVTITPLASTASATYSQGSDDFDPFADVSVALERLRALDERQARVVELRFIVGMSAERAAEILGITRRTVDRDWVHARCWLQRELNRIGAA